MDTATFNHGLGDEMPCHVRPMETDAFSYLGPFRPQFGWTWPGERDRGPGAVSPSTAVVRAAGWTREVAHWSLWMMGEGVISTLGLPRRS
jgi:hypothetical protein